MNRLAVIHETMQRMNLLHDLYGELLTPKQSAYFTMHFMEDMSMAEIAVQFGVTPQAAADMIKRACALLEKYESKLSLLGKHERQAEIVKKINAELDKLQNGSALQNSIKELITELISSAEV